MQKYEKFQARVKAAMEEEAQQKKWAREESERHFRAALEQTLSQEIRDELELKYGWNQEQELPHATFEPWGVLPHPETYLISHNSELDTWAISLESGRPLIEDVLGNDLENRLLLAVGHRQEEAMQPPMQFIDL